jgi:hypothetical protein
MHIQCNGEIYNSDTARRVAGNPCPEWHNGGWTLYRRPDGVYFQVVYGYAGEEIGFSVVWPSEANDLIRKYRYKSSPSSFGRVS